MYELGCGERGCIVDVVGLLLCCCESGQPRLLGTYLIILSVSLLT